MRANILQVQVCQTTPSVQHTILNSKCTYYFNTTTTFSLNNWLNDAFCANYSKGHTHSRLLSTKFTSHCQNHSADDTENSVSVDEMLKTK